MRKTKLFSVSFLPCLVTCTGIALALTSLALMLFSGRGQRLALFGGPSESNEAENAAATFFSYYSEGGKVRYRTDEEGHPVLRFDTSDFGASLWDGFVLESAAEVPPDAILHIRWRFAGTAEHLQVHFTDTPPKGKKKGEDWGLLLPTPNEEWTDVEARLSDFYLNSWQPEDAAKDGLMTTPLYDLNLILPPGTRGALDVERISFSWQNSLVPKILLPILFAAIGVVLAIRSGSRIPAPGTGARTWFPVGAPRVAFALASAAFLADYAANPRIFSDTAPLVFAALLAAPVIFGDFLGENASETRIASYGHAPFFLVWFFAHAHSNASVAAVFLFALVPSIFKRDRTALSIISGASAVAAIATAVFAGSGPEQKRYASAVFIICAISIFSIMIQEYMRRRNNDASLRRAQTLYTAVLSHSSDFIFTLSPQGAVTSVNRALEIVLGRPRDSIAGMAFSDFVHFGADCGSIVGRSNAADSTAHYDACIGFPGGSCREVQLSENAMEEEGITTGYLVVATDITERKKLEQDLKDANARLETLVHLDGLTGIGNRRHFDHRLKEEWDRSVRAGTPLSLIIIDADFFKKYNDAYGHIAGDACLTLLAQTLANQLERSGDTIARYGGEEFAVILPLTDEAGARTVAERMRAAVERLNHRHEGREDSSILTISLGLHSLRPVYGLSRETSKDLVIGADKALYEAKRAGRNRICAFSDLKEDN